MGGGLALAARKTEANFGLFPGLQSDSLDSILELFRRLAEILVMSSEIQLDANEDKTRQKQTLLSKNQEDWRAKSPEGLRPKVSRAPQSITDCRPSNPKP